MEHILFPELIKSDIVVTNMARMFAPAISETCHRDAVEPDARVQQVLLSAVPEAHLECRAEFLVEVDGMTMGIVGMGGIGQAVAMQAHYGFNMRILATDAKPMAKPIFVDTLREPAWFMEMVPQVDILVSAAPSTQGYREAVQ